ncbi:hypothetical protein BCR41DRAFT_417961 [Lobosporangium transversale]|uniref:F-box domain-containing protein n=1 Tax=Lobosporangium transversale TaxID=64571 RepID=A0A1Y2H4D6_9FUNG|nr:hypothetical protein BCR41DRAFT_417961 [Lobosporangium transversale]ORZ28851.1 hypothetical protein BCR41DRAFT_417961 [Lobosporangium transversale]|eukprot:XP_021886524.1 hypothetical protein BCR41DRAFT_417961 [Lobosporangium transversale]
MSKNKMNPLDIPEIVSLIGDFLDRKDLLNCIRVSKAFHSAFVWSIWKIVIIRPPPSSNPSDKALQANKKYIEEIRFQKYSVPEEYRSLRECNRLQFITYEGNGLSDLEPAHLFNLIKANSSTITGVRLNNIRASPNLWKTLLECTNLNRLEASSISVIHDIDLLIQVCKKLQYLDLDGVCISRLPIDFLRNEGSEYIFSSMHTLRFRNVRINSRPQPYTSSHFFGTLVRRCPGLRVLKFDESSECHQLQQLEHDNFYRLAFLQHPWKLTKLSDLSLPSMRIKDRDMATLLRWMTGLTQLNAAFCEFSQLSLQELLARKQEIWDNGRMIQETRLHRLCETIETLIFGQACVVEMSGLVQTVLSNCPRLKILRGSKITVTEIVNGAEWVSTGLTDLVLDLEADIDQETEEGMAKARIAFRQLGRLTRLHYLNLTGWSPMNRGVRTLDLKLRAGLDELAKLKNLYMLAFKKDDRQQIQLEDAAWMVNNWPEIKYLNGRVKGPMDENSLAYDFLKSRKISVLVK